MLNIDTVVERYTDKMHDIYFSGRRRFDICTNCKNEFFHDWEEVCVSKYDPAMLFCCEGCCHKHDESIKHDYEVWTED